HLPVATRNHVRPDAQSRALSGADSLRPKPAPDARCMTLSARSLRRTQDRARRRTLAETGGQSPSACKGGRDQRQGARLATRPARPPACRKTLERWSWAMAVMRRAWLSEKIERVAQAEDDFLDGFPCSFRGVSGCFDGITRKPLVFLVNHRAGHIRRCRRCVSRIVRRDSRSRVRLNDCALSLT